jgi:hypothetical protein
MLGIDPHIFKHEIRTYPDVKPIRQCLRVVNPRKAPDIKAEVEKLLNVGFIYLVPLPFIDQILDGCAGSEIFILWMDFQAITKSRSNPKTNIRWHSYVLGASLHTEKCLSA